MKNLVNYLSWILAALLLIRAGFVGASPAEWHLAWYNSLHAPWSEEFILPTKLPTLVAGDTLTQSVNIGLSGQSFKLRLSNFYGESELRIASVSVSTEGSDLPLFTFKNVAIPAGEKYTSPAVDVPLDRFSSLTVSMTFEKLPSVYTFHWDPRSWSKIERDSDLTKVDVRLFWEAVLVKHADPVTTIVAVGDSITDGNMSSYGQAHRWPDFLNRRLRDDSVVLNAGISGNRLLTSGMGRAVTDRINDIIVLPGVDYVILMIGTNDIAWPKSSFKPRAQLVKVDDLKEGLTTVIKYLKEAGIEVIVSTIPPFEGALTNSAIKNYSGPKKENLRVAFNRFIRRLEGVRIFDADEVLRDPNKAKALNAQFDSGDHLHPSDKGYEALGKAFNMNWFEN